MKFKVSVNLLLLILSCSAITGCIAESSFRLSDESRLPKWFEIPEGKSRGDYYVTLDYYISSSGGSAVLKLYENDSFFKSDKVSAKQEQLHPIQLKNPPKGHPEGYPLYEVIEYKGIIDVIEHRKMEPIFYMTDEPMVLKELGLKGT